MRVIKWRKLRWMGYVARMGEMRNVCNILVEEPEGKGQLGVSKSFRNESITKYMLTTIKNFIEKQHKGL
jgi:hypothetical protein